MYPFDSFRLADVFPLSPFFFLTFITLVMRLPTYFPPCCPLQLHLLQSCHTLSSKIHSHYSRSVKRFGIFLSLMYVLVNTRYRQAPPSTKPTFFLRRISCSTPNVTPSLERFRAPEDALPMNGFYVVARATLPHCCLTVSACRTNFFQAGQRGFERFG